MALSMAARGALAIILLCGSNICMTFAWYLHLKFKQWPIYQAIFISWGIAFFEYVLQVPANRLGYANEGGPFTAPQLKVIQEFITLTAFAIFSTYVLRDKLRWADAGAFMLIFAGVLLSLLTKAPSTEPTSPEAMQQPAHRRLLHLAAWHLSQPAQLPMYFCKGAAFSRALQLQALPPQVQDQLQLAGVEGEGCKDSPKDKDADSHLPVPVADLASGSGSGSGSVQVAENSESGGKEKGGGSNVDEGPAAAVDHAGAAEPPQIDSGEQAGGHADESAEGGTPVAAAEDAAGSSADDGTAAPDVAAMDGQQSAEQR